MSSIIVNVTVCFSLCAALVACDSGGSQATESTKPVSNVAKSQKATETMSQQAQTDLSLAPGDSLFQIIDSMAVDSLAEATDFVEDSLAYGMGSEMVEDQSLLNVPEWLDDHPDMENYSDQAQGGEGGLAQNKLIESKLVKVMDLQYKASYDSVLVVIEERLSIRPDPVAEKLVLEKWKSPVNYRGYKFNRRKLLLFGVEIQQPIAIYHYLDQYFFSLSSSVYELDENFDFAPFALVGDTALVRFILSHEDRF
jgi:hypothetical protein